MDGAASIIAVVSIAVQLADSIKKQCDFWESIKAAPHEVQTIIADLDLLGFVLRDIAAEAGLGQSDATLEKVLRGCGQKLQELDSIFDMLQSGFSSTKRTVRKWTALKSVLKWDKIKQFQTTLDRLKCTLMLVLQNLNR